MKKQTFNLLMFILSWISFGNILAQGEFITTWKTDNPGFSANNQITIPAGYTNNATHTYSAAGTYTLKISGDFPYKIDI